MPRASVTLAGWPSLSHMPLTSALGATQVGVSKSNSIIPLGKDIFADPGRAAAEILSGCAGSRGELYGGLNSSVIGGK
jgi:hypothetical protein